ncbi:ATP-grasp domain-containing protein [Mycobacterium intracellulare]|uniref:ATP-grasp domain-containing protein n=1 Tax=Mycobacterium intracellulare TaxID=1767 RepID=UPI001CDA305F|nr:ATP-grasp domain-containing protein [Mycobacterium intracellulare]MCA2305804.1 ATP-grasp domain-containing protein [Mycobacterium intracellulare]MCA2347955.1 ATP-grasp domain-containing protein [Mycobacterium intracellulare]
MKKILVTGVGGGVGQSVLKALAPTSYEVVATDSEALAAGLHAAPAAYTGLYASDPQFIDRLLEICLTEQCGLIFAGHDVELLPLAETVDRFKAHGIVPVVSSPEIIRSCDDKLATTEFLNSLGLPAPETKKLCDVRAFERPIVLKPQRGGARSRGTYLARTENQFDLYRQLVDPNNCVAQEYIDGDEYTCGSVTLDGKCLGVIIMRRILRDGDTYKAFVEHNPALEATVRTIVEALNPFGACNIQLRVKNGQAYVFEINARCSGTTAARALAGFNEPQIIADYLLNGVAPTYSISEVTILRYWQELVVPNSHIEQLRQTGFLRGDGTQL